ncbi:hypothetical protein ASG90_20575 [Nocardioides sp. Soil797]|nr:hypothetical protein ASG90_20575 [Nocardioides sp. Soil797]
MTIVTELETDLITTPDETSDPRQQITDTAILDTYGPLLWSAMVAFGTDPGYFEAMCLEATSAERKRHLHRERWRLLAVRNRLGTKVELDGECWVWTAATTSKNIPTMKKPGSSANVTARSWTVEQWHGADDTRWMIQASCGNRLCVNPEHATWRHVQRSR